MFLFFEFKPSNKKTKGRHRVRRRIPVESAEIDTRLVEKQEINSKLDLPTESADDRVKQMARGKKRGVPKMNLYGIEQNERDPLIKALRWMNPGDESILECIQAIKTNSPLPRWAVMFQAKLKVIGTKLALGNKIILTMPPSPTTLYNPNLNL